MLAISLLFRRRLPLFDSFAWLLLSIFIPILGPFLTIAFLPKISKSPRNSTKQSKDPGKTYPFKNP